MKVKAAKPYHHGNLRAALIEAGLNLIAEKGVRGLTLRDIGATVGVSRMAAYRHFSDKDDLLAAIAEAGFIEFTRTLQVAKDSAAPKFAERLAAMALAYITFAGRHPAYIEVMFGWATNRSHRRIEAGERAFAQLVETIQEGQSTADVREGDPVVLAQIVWSQVHGMSMLRLATDPSDNAAGANLVRRSSEVLLAGLRPPATARTRRAVVNETNE